MAKILLVWASKRKNGKGDIQVQTNHAKNNKHIILEQEEIVPIIVFNMYTKYFTTLL